MQSVLWNELQTQYKTQKTPPSDMEDGMCHNFCQGLFHTSTDIQPKKTGLHENGAVTSSLLHRLGHKSYN
jgi:hypothetical protein